MSWEDGLTLEQKCAASAHCGHVRLLAGPGTGKTFVIKARVQYLIEELSVCPSEILIVTFTRRAVAELREKITPCIPEGDKFPRISTLHGFALRQLLKNANLIDTLPKPLRVADDWEEDNIIIPDLMGLMDKERKDVKKTLDAMSSDWNTLTDAELNADPHLIAAWDLLRNVYGFSLRSEMVYRLKRAMEQHDRFELEGQFQHVIVDEFQDLNACDLAVVEALSVLGISVFCAGDDDQSIYGFRNASPEGIRNFVDTFPEVEDHKLTLCKRCYSEILDAAEHVANLDRHREKKDLEAENDGGMVRLFSATDQHVEAKKIAVVCQTLHNEYEFKYPEIAILLRSDYQFRFSQPIIEVLAASGVPVSGHKTEDPLSKVITRHLYALAQLAVSPEDSLAARTLLQLAPGVGPRCIKEIESLAENHNMRYLSAIQAVVEDASLLPTVGRRVAAAWNQIETAASKLIAVITPNEDRDLTYTDLQVSLTEAASVLGLHCSAVDDLMEIASETESSSLTELLARTTTVGERLEPQIDPDSVNIMTMHQAKGLTFDCVIIPGLEDELIPGKNNNPVQKEDERRLLYVSMTRARKVLVLFYATRRTGAQAFSGRTQSTRDRHLTQFLAHYKFKKD